MPDATLQTSVHQKALTMSYKEDLTATKHEVATGSRKLFGWLIDNSLNNANVFVKVWDLAAADVTVGTTAPTFVIPVSAGAIFDILSAVPLKELGTGFTVAVTTTAPTSGSTAPEENVGTSFWYK